MKGLIVRAATLRDVEIVVELGIEALENDPYENMVISKERVRDMTKECISSNANFCWVAEYEGVVVAAVSAMVFDFMFYERKQCNVVQFWTRKSGAGIVLMREFLKWARKRRIIKMIIFTLECNVDPRVGKLLGRLGLKSELPIYVEYR